MIIEHTFVTTLEPEKAMGIASSFLVEHGFAAKTQSAFQIDPLQWNHLEMQRGKTGTLDPLRCLQIIVMDYDRGRITLAARISPSYGNSRSASVEPSPGSKTGMKYVEIIHALALALDDMLARGVEPAIAGSHWSQLQLEYSAKIKWRKKRDAMIIWPLIILFVVGIIFAIRMVVH